MPDQYLIQPEVPQVPRYDEEQMAQGLGKELALFLFPLLVTLDRLMDNRLVRTFLHTIAAIIAYRDRVGGLLLTELGGVLASPDQAPAGTKRLSNRLAFAPSGRHRILRTSCGSKPMSKCRAGNSRDRMGWRSGMAVNGKSRKALRWKAYVRCARVKPNA